ncbi:unnamed protein product, partial [marine sediment metagenome]
ANPEPEIKPELAMECGVRIIATGRSDYPNQVNNVLAFPGIFRGALDARAIEINTEMKLAAVKAISEIVSDNLKEDYIIPNIIDLDFRNASNHLKSLGLIVISSKAPLTGMVNEPGIVMKVIPSPGTEVGVNSVVKIIISTNEPLVLVPDLIQFDLGQAKNILDSDNINYEISYINTDYSVQEGTVLGQNPEAGTYISPGSSIILFIGR